MHIMNNCNEFYPLITLYNALYIKALGKVLPNVFTFIQQGCFKLVSDTKDIF